MDERTIFDYVQGIAVRFVKGDILLLKKPEDIAFIVFNNDTDPPLVVQQLTADNSFVDKQKKGPKDIDVRVTSLTEVAATSFPTFKLANQKKLCEAILSNQINLTSLAMFENYEKWAQIDKTWKQKVDIINNMKEPRDTLCRTLFNGCSIFKVAGYREHKGRLSIDWRRGFYVITKNPDILKDSFAKTEDIRKHAAKTIQKWRKNWSVVEPVYDEMEDLFNNLYVERKPEDELSSLMKKTFIGDKPKKHSPRRKSPPESERKKWRRTYEKRTKDELRDIAHAFKLRYYTHLSKNDLIEFLIDNLE